MMSRSKFSIRNYNAALRELKRGTGITHVAAQRAYRTVRDRLGRSPRAADIKRHPRIKAQETKKAREWTPKKRAPLPAALPVPVKSLEEWIDMYDEWIDDEGIGGEEWESTADYAESPK